MLRQAADLACRVSAAALATQGAATMLPGALATALRALGASQLRGFTTGKPLGPRYQARRGCGCRRSRRCCLVPVRLVPVRRSFSGAHFSL